MRLTHNVVAALLLASGCVGTVDDLNPPVDSTPDAGTPPVSGGQGQALYTRDVHPIQLAKCSGAACHSQPAVTGIYGYVLEDPNASYQQLVTLPILVGTYTPANAGILTQIDPGPHQTAVYTPEEKGLITAWLAQEVADRTEDPGAPPLIDPIQRLRDWSGCMSLENFEAADMAEAWGDLAAVNLQKCANCHAQGLESFMSGNGNAEIFFTAITTYKDLLLKYFTVDSTGAIIINTNAFQNAAVNLPNANAANHPRFDPVNNIGMIALTEFYDLTMARQVAMTCDPPRLP